ncbi:MAG: glycosyltransferase family 4 protein [Pseudomonadota bacterium]
MKLFYVVNEANFFVSHRLSLGLRALREGHDVTVVTAPHTGEDQLPQHGFNHVSIPLSRSGFNLWQERKSYVALKRLYAEQKPDLVHHVTIKPVIYGSLAATESGVKAVVNAVPGMGFVFSREGPLSGLGRWSVNLLYRWAFKHPQMRVIFQNTEDMQAFLGHAIVSREQAVLIRGSGVDLDVFAGPRVENEQPVFLLAARMLKDKGVYEFAQAAARVLQRHQDWQFLVAGGEDLGNPSSLSDAELQRLETEYGVRWLGHVDDMPSLMKRADVVCLPTYYREGLPKCLLEASAAGCAMIASDIAGCREAVTPGVTGLLVPPKEVPPLARAMITLGEDADLRKRLGESARKKAQAIFGVDDVVEHTFRVYEEVT